jgi:hypothetical protein
MNTDQGVKADERTLAVARAANSWGLNVITFALLVDIIYRAGIRKEECWDLFAVVGVGGAISMAYMARHKVLWQLYSRKRVIGAVVVAFVTAVAVFFLTWRAFLH